MTNSHFRRIMDLHSLEAREEMAREANVPCTCGDGACESCFPVDNSDNRTTN